MSETNRATPVEIGAWVAFAIAAVIYGIAFIITGNAGYDEDTTSAVRWMMIAGTVAGVTVVPAIILTGIRQLVPALRDVRAGEGGGRGAEDGSTEA